MIDTNSLIFPGQNSSRMFLQINIIVIIVKTTLQFSRPLFLKAASNLSKLRTKMNSTSHPRKMYLTKNNFQIYNLPNPITFNNITRKTKPPSFPQRRKVTRKHSLKKKKKRLTRESNWRNILPLLSLLLPPDRGIDLRGGGYAGACITCAAPAREGSRQCVPCPYRARVSLPKGRGPFARPGLNGRGGGVYWCIACLEG